MKTILKIECIKTLVIRHGETGTNARTERTIRGVSLRGLARKMKISAPYLSDLERGKRNWTIKIARRFEASLDGVWPVKEKV